MWKSMILGILGAGVLTFPSDADAVPEGAPDRYLFGKPVRDQARRSELEDARHQREYRTWLQQRGWVQSGDLILPARSFEPDVESVPPSSRGGTWEEPPHRATIFLNFFGGEMTNGGNAAEMESQCIMGTVQYPAYVGSEAQALSMIQVFQNDMEPYGVNIAFEDAPPQHLPYQMVMMGGRPQDIGMDAGSLGVSCAPDCGDTWWRDTTFAFTEVSNNALTLGHTALQEAAHAFGLAHINGTQHIMYPVAGSGDKIWAQDCSTYNSSTGGINCQSIHDIWCGDGAQHDEAELMAYFGTAGPDSEPPTVEIVEPDGDVTVDVGATVEVRVEVSDNHEGYGWRLRVTDPAGDEQIVNAYKFEDAWALANLSEGQWFVAVDAIDHDLNETTDEIVITVGEGDGTDQTGTGDVGTGDTSDDGDSGGTGEPDPTGGGDPKGCGCVARSDGPGLAWIGVVVGGLWRRRRRSSKRRK